MSWTAEQARNVLSEVLEVIRKDYESPYPVLCEADRSRFVTEEGSLSNQLKDAITASSNGWRGLLHLPSPQVVKCLESAKELRQRVKDEIHSRLRTRFRSSADPSLNFDWKGISLVETDVSQNSRSPSVVISPSQDEAPKLDEDPLLESSGAVDSSSQRRRSLRSSPPPLQQMGPSNDSQPLSETSGDSGSDSSRSSSPIRRAALPPPSPRHSLRSPTNDSIAPSASLSSGATASIDTPGDSRHFSSVRWPAPPPPQLPEQSVANSWQTSDFSTAGVVPRVTTTRSTSKDSSSGSPRRSPSARTPHSRTSRLGQSKQGQGQHRTRHNDYVSRTGYIEIAGANVAGVTLNNGGSNNSGAVVHTTYAMP